MHWHGQEKGFSLFWTFSFSIWTVSFCTISHHSASMNQRKPKERQECGRQKTFRTVKNQGRAVGELYLPHNTEHFSPVNHSRRPCTLQGLIPVSPREAWCRPVTKTFYTDASYFHLITFQTVRKKVILDIFVSEAVQVICWERGPGGELHFRFFAASHSD